MRIKITGKGIYSMHNGGFQELPVGTELTVQKIPKGWKDRCTLLSDSAGKTPVNNQPEQPDPQQEVAEPKAGQSEIEELREMAEELGVSVDKRWGVSRLKSEIEKA